MLADIVKRVRSRTFRWIDDGEYRFSACHVDNVCQGILLAAEKGQSGEPYFLADRGDYHFREFFTALLATQGVTPGRQSISFRTAWLVAALTEMAWPVLGRKGNPPITRQILRMVGQPFTVDIKKAQRDLGYEPIVTLEKGLQDLREKHLANKVTPGKIEISAD
jgi:nucleoside-diphosphate-sugar epimerase